MQVGVVVDREVPGPADDQPFSRCGREELTGEVERHAAGRRLGGSCDRGLFVGGHWSPPGQAWADFEGRPFARTVWTFTHERPGSPTTWPVSSVVSVHVTVFWSSASE
jgi:hypothetical protein